jgi:hypothetical protein
MKSKTVTYFDLLMAAMSLTMALALPAGAQQIKMAYSGTSTGASAVNLQHPGTVNVEENFEGNGALGAFTFRLISAETNTPQEPPNTCAGPNNIFFTRVSGAGVFRFQDNSLLKVILIQGADCIDLSKPPGQGNCVLTLKITGGTGRFKDASGTLTLTETNVPVLADALNNPVFFATTGEITGTISGVAGEWDHQE